MKLEFKTLTLHNFISFGHTTLDILDDGFIRVSGLNESSDDLANSNGSGKSSLWEGIVWALTGDTIRGTKQIGNIYGDDGTYVYLCFYLDGVMYELLRSKEHKEYKTNLQIRIDGEDRSGKGIRESEKLLTQYLPDITASLLGSVIILGQGLPQKFTNNSPSGRKEVLEKLSKSDFMIEDLKNRVGERKSELSLQIRGHQDDSIHQDSQIRLLEKQISDAITTLSQMDKSSVEEQIEGLQSIIVAITSDINKELVEVENLKELIQSYRDSLLAVTEESHQEEKKVRDGYADASLQGSITLTKVLTEMTQISKQISDLERIKDVCPTCGQKLPGVVRPDTTALSSRLEELRSTEKDIRSRNTQLNLEMTDAVSSVTKKYLDEIRDINNNITALTNRLNEHTATLNALYKKSDDNTSLLQSAKVQLAQFETTESSLIRTIEDNKAQKKQLEALLEQNNATIEQLKSRLDIITKFETSLKRDFRGYLLYSIIEYIKKRAVAYSKIIFNTDKIEFCLDGNNIEISYLGKPYENLSGGERQKVDLIVQFSIRDMLCNHIGFTSNILVLDEVFDGLDTIGCQKVLDVISGISDVKNIFIVTHRKDLSIPTDKEIVVIKSHNGISELHQ